MNYFFNKGKFFFKSIKKFHTKLKEVIWAMFGIYFELKKKKVELLKNPRR